MELASPRVVGPMAVGASRLRSRNLGRRGPQFLMLEFSHRVKDFHLKSDFRVCVPTL